MRSVRTVLMNAAPPRAWVLGVVTAALAIAGITNLPGVPYNVRELLRPDVPVLSAALLAVAIGTMAMLPRWLRLVASGIGAARALIGWPLLLLGVAASAASIIWGAVPDEAVYDVVGSPVLDWWGPSEVLLRLTALLAGVLWLPLGGAIWLWPRANGGATIAGLFSVWLLWSLALLPSVHLVVVEFAATDNLTELMAGGGSVGASLALGAYLALIGSAGAGVARARRTSSGVAWTVAALAASSVIGWWLVQLGTASSLVKYGSTFSALQFLLSADRDHYVVGIELLARFVAFHLLLVAASAWSQWLALIVPSVGLAKSDGFQAGDTNRRPK